MRNCIFIVILILIGSSLSLGQSFSKEDSLNILRQSQEIFTLIENPIYKDFEKISSDDIYCLECFSKDSIIFLRDFTYLVSRKDFYNKHIERLKNEGNFTKAAKSDEINIIEGDKRVADYIILFTVYKKDEIANGHEGGQLGIYFKKTKDSYKFSGFETIP